MEAISCRAPKFCDLPPRARSRAARGAGVRRDRVRHGRCTGVSHGPLERDTVKMRRRGAIAAGLCAIAGLACWRAPLRGIDFGPERDPFRNAGHIEPEEIPSRPAYRLLLVGHRGTPAPAHPPTPP